GERVMSRIGTTGRFPAPDLDALRPRVAQLRRLTQRGEPRVLSAPELAAGFVLSDGLPSPTGYEPALPPRRMTRVGQHLGFQHLLTPWPEKAWAAVAASPNVAAAVGLGIVVPRARDAPVLRAAGFRHIGRLPAGAAAPRGLHAEGRADRSRRAQRRPGLRPTVLPARRRPFRGGARARGALPGHRPSAVGLGVHMRAGTSERRSLAALAGVPYP